MTADQARAWFLELAPRSKPAFVALLSHNLTVAARASYPGQIEEGKAAERLRVYNELQHTVSAKLMYLSLEEVNGFPDEGFLDVLFEKASHCGCVGEVLQAFAWSRTALERTLRKE